MSTMALAEHQEDMISSFLGVAEGQTYDTACRCLEAQGWNLDDALRDFFLGGGGGGSNDRADEDEDVYTFPELDETDDEDMGYEFEEEEEEKEIVDTVFPMPNELMFRGTFEMAKQAARFENKWLLVNLQDFSSDDTLSGDSWTAAMADVVKGNFVFFQDVDASEEGAWIRRCYNLEYLPVIMVIEPITGRKIQDLFGRICPENLMEILLNYSGSNPVDYCMSPYKQEEQKLEQLMEDLNLDREVTNVEDDGAGEPGFPPLPEEPNENDRKVVCKVGVRLPCGRRIQRKFLLSDPIQVLWSFCCSEMEEAAKRPFSIGFATPTRFECLDYSSSSTLGESGAANCMLSFRWD